MIFGFASIIKWISIACLMLYFIFPAKCLAISTIELPKKVDSIIAVDYLMEREKHLDVNVIASAEMESKFSRSTNTPSLGYSQNNIWFRVRVTNTLSHSALYYYAIDFSYLDSIEVYVKRENSLQKIAELGHSYQGTHEIFSNTYNKSIVLGSLESADLYFKVFTTSSVVFPLKFYTKESFVKSNVQSFFVMGLYFGFVLMIIIYNLAFFQTTKTKKYYSYIFYLLSLLSFMFLYSGYFGILVSETSSHLVAILRRFLLGSSMFFAFQFAREYLDTKAKSPKINICMIGTQMAAVSGICLSFFNVWVSTIYFSLLMIPMPVFFLIIIISYGVKDPVANYYNFSWLLFVVGISLNICVMVGLVPINFFTVNAFLFGSALEILVLSSGISYKINALQKEILQNRLEAELIEANVVAKEIEFETAKLMFQSEIDTAHLSEMGKLGLSMSHKLNSPLQTINFIVEEAEDELKNPTLKVNNDRLRGYFQKIQEKCQMIREEVNALKYFRKFAPKDALERESKNF